MGLAAKGVSPVAQGRALYESRCAACHGPTGGGSASIAGLHPPKIAGESVGDIATQVRLGGHGMPAFPEAALPAPALANLMAYVHDGMTRAPDESSLGPRDLDPFAVGLIVMGAIAVLALSLMVLFSGRHA